MDRPAESIRCNHPQHPQGKVSDYLTTSEAAERLRCHEKTVRRMIGRGEIDAVLVAGRYLIDADALPLSLPPRPPPPLRRPGQAGELTELARKIAGAR